VEATAEHVMRDIQANAEKLLAAFQKKMQNIFFNRGFEMYKSGLITK
jgi:hypothetical protein